MQSINEANIWTSVTESFITLFFICFQMFLIKLIEFILKKFKVKQGGNETNETVSVID